MLKDKSYEHHAAQTWTSEIVTQVRSQCRQLSMPAYKLIVSAVLGEVKGQGIKIASKCLWDVQNDNYATFTYQNEKLFCTCMVFGIYYE